jgi:hypothetical protein
MIRRDLLWAKLEGRGLDGAWLAAVRALHAEVRWRFARMRSFWTVSSRC